jgi:hypothetical protein
MRNLDQSNFFQLHKRCPRTSPRTRVYVAGVLAKDDHSEPCLIRDISPNGAQIRIGASKHAPHDAYLIDLNSRFAYHAHPIWRQGSLAGLQFDREYVIDSLLPFELAFLDDHFRAAKLRLVNQLAAQGMKMAVALQKCGLTHDLYCQWGGTIPSQ